jgi:hypothetical protein
MPSIFAVPNPYMKVENRRGADKSNLAPQAGGDHPEKEKQRGRIKGPMDSPNAAFPLWAQE